MVVTFLVCILLLKIPLCLGRSKRYNGCWEGELYGRKADIAYTSITLDGHPSRAV